MILYTTEANSMLVELDILRRLGAKYTRELDKEVKPQYSVIIIVEEVGE